MSAPMKINQGGYVPPGFSAPSIGYGQAPYDERQQQYVVPPMTAYNSSQQQYVGPPMTAYNSSQQQYGGAPMTAYNGVQQPYGGGDFQLNYMGPQPPITVQPGQPMAPSGDWMSIPNGIPNCPPGLEYLTTIDQLLVKQKVELLEAFIGFETNNKFTVKNSLGQKVYYAVENNDCCTRNMCGPSRPFEMKIFDNFRNEVISLNRPLRCSCCLFPCCLQKMEVSAPPGNLIGSIEQEWSICTPLFSIKNHIADTVLRIEGPICKFAFCGDVEFNILSLTGENIGRISKQWSGLAREIFTDSDFFGITFPMDLDVRMKAVLLGATFLIDAMFFEKSGNREMNLL